MDEHDDAAAMGDEEEPMTDRKSKDLSNFLTQAGSNATLPSTTVSTSQDNVAEVQTEAAKRPTVEEGEAVIEPEVQMGVALLQEDQPIFDIDSKRMKVALTKLDTFRERVETQLLQPLQNPDAAKQFCSDATLLRYLCTVDSNLDRAQSMLKATIQWRTANLSALPANIAGGSHPDADGQLTSCPCCAKDPRSHCFLRLGVDALGRHVIYSCAGRASNKTVDDGMKHMSSEMERIFRGNSSEGKVVWLLDFAGFGISDCNPRTGAVAVPMFANHYPERFGQIILFGIPTIATAMFHAGMRVVDQVTRRKVLILKTDAARKRYADAYWSVDVGMMEWIEAVLKCKGVPGMYPSDELNSRLADPVTRSILSHCKSLKK